MQREEDEQTIIRVISPSPMTVSKRVGSPAPSIRITRLEVNTNQGMKLLWSDGVAHEVRVAPGPNWELYVYYSATSLVAYWAAAVSIWATANVPAQYSSQAKSNRYLTSGVYNDRVNFEMGALPAGAVGLRVKVWTSDYFTTDVPPADQW